MWAVTRALNEYNQDGDYLVCVFKDKPDFQRLKTILSIESDEVINNLLEGGGRLNTEDEWFFLTELQDGEEYSSHNHQWVTGHLKRKF